MDSQGNPLLIPELVDYFITYLRNSPSDLRACALVSRSWIYAASQSHLFREVVLKNESVDEVRWSRLHDVIQVSPHLVQHIRRLELSPIRLSRETFSAACNFPFTRLEVVMIFLFEDADFIDIQQLFSLPTLRRLEIEPQLIDSVTFTQIWDHISPSIRHDSLSLRIWVPSAYSACFRPTCNVSSIFRGSLYWISAPLRIQLAPNYRSLEVLDFAPPDGLMSVDLSFSETGVSPDFGGLR
ncbi:hypothetical protein C8R43DRAFT_1131290 [Mycena crocata]|nr:hypothetical protein C8R43DRAFT_1131290 [Mycena crocata]